MFEVGLELVVGRLLICSKWGSQGRGPGCGTGACGATVSSLTRFGLEIVFCRLPLVEAPWIRGIIRGSCRDVAGGRLSQICRRTRVSSSISTDMDPLLEGCHPWMFADFRSTSTRSSLETAASARKEAVATRCSILR